MAAPPRTPPAGTAIAALDGEWTIHRAAERRETLLALLAEGATQLDLAAVSDFDTAGLQLLLGARASLAQRGLQLELLHPAPAVCAVLDGWRLDHTLAPLSEALP